MEQNNVRLKPGAEIYHDSGGYGLRLGDNSRRAKDEAQNAVLRALSDGHSSLDELLAAVTSAMPNGTPPCMAALALADFVLEFENYLEK